MRRDEEAIMVLIRVRRGAFGGWRRRRSPRAGRGRRRPVAFPLLVLVLALPADLPALPRRPNRRAGGPRPSGRTGRLRYPHSPSAATFASATSSIATISIATFAVWQVVEAPVVGTATEQLVVAAAGPGLGEGGERHGWWAAVCVGIAVVM